KSAAAAVANAVESAASAAGGGIATAGRFVGRNVAGGARWAWHHKGAILAGAGVAGLAWLTGGAARPFLGEPTGIEGGVGVGLGTYAAEEEDEIVAAAEMGADAVQNAVTSIRWLTDAALEQIKGGMMDRATALLRLNGLAPRVIEHLKKIAD